MCKLLTILCLIIITVVMNGSACADDLTITGNRPVATGIEAIEHLYHIPVTYEDTLYFNQKEIEDTTNSVRRDNKQDTADRVFVPRSRSITFALIPSHTDSAAEAQGDHSVDAVQAVDNLLKSYTSSAGIEAFSVIKDDAGLHVVSNKTINAAGSMQDIVPLLDRKISVHATDKSAMWLIDEICRLASIHQHIKVEGGTVPMNLLSQSLMDVNADNEPARKVLEEVIDKTFTPLSWEMFCDPGNNGCALNVHMVEQKVPDAHPKDN